MSSSAPRRRFNVGAVKLPYAERDVAHAVLTPGDDRGFLDIMGANTPDRDPDFPVGSHVTYSVELTEEEAERFAAASNARYVEEDRNDLVYARRRVGRPTGTAHIPSLSTLANMRARYVDLTEWHGRDVTIGLCDQGTTPAMRAAMGITLVARTVTTGAPVQGNGLVKDENVHGCLTASCLVPAGGRLLDAVHDNADGTISVSGFAAAIVWCVDNGAQIVLCSVYFPGSEGQPENWQQAVLDAIVHAQNSNVLVMTAAGNDGNADLTYPSSISRTRSNVHSSIAFDEATDRRGLFSNYHADASGCGPGVNVLGLDINGRQVLWNGTSASQPHMAQLMARALTGGRFTTTQVGQAFKNNTRDTGAGASQQGGGAYDLHRALAALGVGSPPPSPGVASPVHVDCRGLAGIYSGVNLAPAPGVQVDDMQIVVVTYAPSLNQPLVVPDGWVVLANEEYWAAYERAAAQNVDPPYVTVLAKAYTADQPTSQLLSFGGGARWMAMAIMTVRAAGGLDPERFVPVVRCGVGTAVEAVPVTPATTNDMQVSVFAQLQQTGAATGTLSLPSGLTQRGFFRAADAKGYSLLVATRQLSDGNRTPTYTSTANGSGTWASVSMTIPSAAPAVTPVVQSEPPGPPGGLAPFLPRA